MSDVPSFLRALEGAGGLLSLVCIVGLLALRGHTPDPAIRRRAVFAVLLFLLFVVARLPLLFLDPTLEGPQDEVLPNPTYQILDVFSLLAFSLALFWTLLLFVVDAFLVGRLRWEVPRILSDVGLILFFALALLVIPYYKTDLDITGLFTTAGLLSIVIGLALQDTLGNVFAGLSLQLERPFKAGDWVSFGSFEGVITDVSWRSTQFRTRNNDLVTVPNATLSKESFINHSSPSKISGRTVEIGVAYRHPPANVKRVLLAACKEVPEILERPAPLVRLTSFDDSSIAYQVKFWVKDYAAILDIEEAFRTVIWYAFQREGIEIPFPIQTEIQVEPPSAEQQREDASEYVLDRLRNVEFLSPLSEEELRILANRAKLFEYYTNETICRQDDEGDSFFLLDHGEVVVQVSKNGKQEEVVRLGPPQFFGEMALCTGEKRNATVRAVTPTRLLVIDSEAFKSVIIANPDLATEISKLLVKRQVELSAKRDALDRALAASQDEDSRQILAKIRSFFGFGAGAGAAN